MFCLKSLAKAQNLSLLFKLGLLIKFEVRKIKFELKKERNVIFRIKQSGVHFLEAT